MKNLHCRDVGSRWFTTSGIWNCDFIARGKSNEEILKSESEHAKAVHASTFPPSVAKEAELRRSRGMTHHRSPEVSLAWIATRV